jgi:hypothetical protein
MGALVNTFAFTDLMAKFNCVITTGSDDYLMREKLRGLPDQHLSK